MNIPTDAQFFSKHDPSKPDVAFLKNHFYREGRISEDHAMWIIEKGSALLRLEPNVLQVDAPITGRSHLSFPFCARTVVLIFIFAVVVCGDIHGQYVRGRVLFIGRYELTDSPWRRVSMT